MCQEQDPEVVKGVLPYWSKIYCKISVVSCSLTMFMLQTNMDYQDIILYILHEVQLHNYTFGVAQSGP